MRGTGLAHAGSARAHGWQSTCPPLAGRARAPRATLQVGSVPTFPLVCGRAIVPARGALRKLRALGDHQASSARCCCSRTSCGAVWHLRQLAWAVTWALGAVCAQWGRRQPCVACTHTALCVRARVVGPHRLTTRTPPATHPPTPPHPGRRQPSPALPLWHAGRAGQRE
jgi:hypothetical protein